MCANLVAADLELGKLLRGVPVRGPGNVAERSVEDRLGAVDVERDLELEELVALAPVDLGVEADG